MTRVSARVTKRFLAIVIAAQAVSALLFVALTAGPVIDEQGHLLDVQRYVSRGISVATIKAHVNPAGPGGQIWMSLFGRLFGPHLWAYRFGSLAAWLLLLALFAWVSKRTPGRRRSILAALLAMAVAPYALMTTSLTLTEAPAMLFAVGGSLVWLVGAARERTWRGDACCVVGGLMIGLAAVTRQYYIGLCAALAATAAWMTLQNWRRRRPVRTALVISAIVAFLPLLVLIAIWGGVVAPSVAAVSLTTTAKYSKVAWNPTRPLFAAFYVCFYLALLSFPSLLPSRGLWRVAAGIAALAAAIAMAVHWPRILSLGPLMFAASRLAARAPWMGAVFAALAGGAAAWAAVAVIERLRRRWPAISTHPESQLAFAFVCLFVIEQMGVGGSLRFLEIYTFQVVPFLGWLLVELMDDVSPITLVLWTATTLLSHAMLWRYMG